MKNRAGYIIAAIVIAATVGFIATQIRGRPPATAADAAITVPLFTNLGTHQRAVTTSSEEAQRFFDQGLRLTYAFNHAEAIEAFEQALRLDAGCAMCAWGVAYAYGPNINAPMDSASGVLAYDAVQRALLHAEVSAPVERALIDALALRYAPIPPADRAALDEAYASAMADVRSRFLDDMDVLTLHAEAVMDLRPWDYWARDGSPRPGTAELVADLERVLATQPDHPGACHYYIHALEAVQPERAVSCAERLAALMPGAGHIVHMPAHIYIRVGRWADAITTNEHAVHSDEAYIADRRPSGVYPVAYYPHNYHFLSFAAAMAARSEQAVSAARSLVANVPVEVARQVPPVEPLLPYLHLTLVTFGRWADVLNEPLPPSDLRYATAMVHYARGVALAATGDIAAARAAVDTIRAVQRETADPLNATVLDIALHALMGEIDFRTDALTGAEAHFRQAMALEDGLLYIEPPHWYYPIRHSLGAVLLRAGRPADAERLYREDLARFPENGWSLQGLAASLRAQGREAEAGDIPARLARLGSDVEFTSSRY